MQGPLGHQMPDPAKRAAASYALQCVESGMKLGLGTGSTANIFIDLLGERVASGLDVLCVPTSEQSAGRARALQIRLASLDDEPVLDLTIDGADECDPELRLIKGGGGALLREKIVAKASKRLLIIADASKAVPYLGRFPLPVEVNKFGLAATRLAVQQAASAIGCEGQIDVRRSHNGDLFVTDGGHLLLDCHFGRIGDPDALGRALHEIPGVVEHGLFLGLATSAVLASEQGELSILGHRLA